MRSAQEITNATSTIFSNIYNQAHCEVETIRDSQAEKSRQLAAFEMKFKEEAEREEKQALNDISVILSKLTSKKTAIVYDASRNIREHDLQEVISDSIHKSPRIRADGLVKATKLVRSSVAQTPTFTGPVSALAKHGAPSPNESTASRIIKPANRYTTLSMLMLLLSCLFTLVSAQGPGFLSLDCGGDTQFTDHLGLKWSPDRLTYGQAVKISTPTRAETQYMSLRHFPADSGKYCYKLNVTSSNRYLVRASFLYGNFDNNSVNPRFSIYIGSTYWATIVISDASKVERAELVFLASTSSVSVCLSNATSGQPFISTLELRQLGRHMYYTEFADRYHMSVVARINFGAESEDSVRYPDDPFDRIWESDLKANYLVDETAVGTVRRVSTTLPIETGNSIRENPPQKVMQTAVVGANGSLAYHLKLDGFPGSAWLYTCFAEIEDLADDESRRFRLILPDLPNDQPNLILNFQTAYRDYESGFPNITLPLLFNFGFAKTLDSSKGPILNAMEIIKHLPITDGPVDHTKQKGGDDDLTKPKGGGDKASASVIIALVCVAIVILVTICCCIVIVCKIKQTSEPPPAEVEVATSSSYVEEVATSSSSYVGDVGELHTTSSSEALGNTAVPLTLHGPIHGR